jgi:hypothetical protein
MTINVTGVTGYVMGYVTGKHRIFIGLLLVLRGFVHARTREDYYLLNTLLNKYIYHAHGKHPVTPVTPVTRLYTCGLRMLRGTHDPITPHHNTYLS